MIAQEPQVFAEFLKPGILPSDVDALFPLLQSAHIIDVLIAFFRGGREARVGRMSLRYPPNVNLTKCTNAH